MINAYLGSEYPILAQIVVGNMFAVAIFVASIVCAVIIVALNIYFRAFMDSKVFWGLINLCAMFILTGIWVLFDSEIVLLLTTNLKFVSYVSFFSFMLIPLFLMNFVQMLLEEQYKEFKLISLCFLINLFACFFYNGLFELR